MKMTISQRIMVLVLTVCLLLSMVPALDFGPRVEAASNSWNKIGGTAAASNITAETDAPFNASFAGNITAYYDRKIDVVDGTKISFKVNFPVITDGLILQYAFSLVNRAGSFYTSDTLASSFSMELVSTIANGTANPVTVTASKKLAGANRAFIKTFASSLSNPRNTTDIYDVTFEKINETVNGVNYSWRITIAKGSASYSYMYAASDIAHDLFKDGAYLALGTMAGSSTHTVAVSNLSVTVSQPEPEPTEPEPTEPEPTEPAADPEGWNVVSGAAVGLVPESDKSFNASFSNYVTGYYNKKIEVVDGTTISFKVNFPKLSDGVLLQYSFSLMDRAKSFYMSDNVANSMSVELTSTVFGGKAAALSATASKKVAGAGSRTFLKSLTTSLANRSTTDVYDVTFQKIDETINGVNYSWKLTIAKGTTSYSYMYAASDISHNLFKDGVYLALGSMAGSTTHTVAVSDLSVTVSEPEPEPEPEPVEDPEGWNAVSGTAAGLVPESDKSFNATFSDYVTGYYNKKIEVVDGTTISFKTKIPKAAANTALHFGFSLVDAPKSYYLSDTVSNAVSVEVQSNTVVDNQWPVRAVISKKVAGGTNRQWLANIPNPLAADRNTTDIYTITFQKINDTVGGVEYSWKITVDNGKEVQTCLVKASDVSHSLFKDGMYLAAGALNTVTGHAVSISDLSVTKEDAVLEDPEGWNVISGTKERLSVDAQRPENATFAGSVTGYYNNKIAVEDGTTISFKVNFSGLADGAALQYGFSLVDAARSFYMSDTVSNAVSVELQSNTAVETKWPMRAVVSKKVAGGANRQWLANIANPLAADRNTTDVYTITIQKVSGTVDGVEYSWKVTVDNGKEVQTCLIKASDVSHDLSKNGVYLAVGTMTSVTGHTMKLSDMTITKEPVVLTDPEGWNVVSGAEERLVVDPQKPENATFTGSVTGYYNKKIDVVEGTVISFDVSLPVMAAGETLHYGFSLVDKAKSFYQSDSIANSISLEFQSNREVNGKWPVNAVFSLKNAGAGRTWIANLGGPLAVDRNTQATYTITYQKIDETVDNINYSWYVTVSDGTNDYGYGVKASDVPHDRFKNGAYVAVGTMTSISNHTMKIANLASKVSEEKFDTDKLVDLSKIWKIVRGYSGQQGKGLTYKAGKVIMEGYGGLAYVKESVKNAVSVEFELNNYSAKGSFFSFGLVNKEGVYYNPNGSESQGIYVRIKEVNGVFSVELFTVTKGGSVAIGELTSTRKAKGTKHTITFFKSGGKWYAALDGQQKMRIDERVDLKDVSHLCAGASQTSNLSMTVHNVYVDGNVTSAMKAGRLKAGYKVNGFRVVRGYGKGGSTTGTGLSENDGKTVMQGYGGLAYVDGTVKDAVAVDFELNQYEGNSYFFSFGLVNKPDVYYNPNGSESQGIFVRIKSWQNGLGMNVTVFNLTKAGSEELGTIVTNVPPKDTKHNIAFFREDGVWYVSIDSYQKMKLNVEVDLGNTSYLCAGASTAPELTMSVYKVYLNDKVTNEMKGGTEVLSAVAGSGSGEGNAVGGTSTEMGEGDLYIALGENAVAPDNIVNSTGNFRMIAWILVGAVVCAVFVILLVCFFPKKKEE